MVTPALFEAFPTVNEMAKATAEDIFPYIKSISYPNAKAKHLAQMAAKIVAEFDGNVPTTIDDLTTLPGVGRKTANVMLAVAFGGQAMPVDTHVFRVSHRIGLVPKRCTTLQTVAFPDQYLVCIFEHLFFKSTDNRQRTTAFFHTLDF